MAYQKETLGPFKLGESERPKKTPKRACISAYMLYPDFQEVADRLSADVGSAR